MVIRMTCPLGHRLLADESMKGKKFQCPICLNFLYVPVLHPRSSGKQKKAWNADGTAMAEQLAEEALMGDDDEPIPADAFHSEDGGSADTGSPQPSIPTQPSVPQQPTVPFTPPMPSAPPAPMQYQPPQAPASSMPTNPAEQQQSNPLPYQPPQSQPMASPFANPTSPVASAPEVANPNVPTPGTGNAEPQPVPAAANSPFDHMPELANLQAPEAIPELRLTDTDSPSLRIQAGMSKMLNVYLLAFALLATCIGSLVPALPHYHFLEAPMWARVVFCVGILQLIYVIWMVALPDWSTVWVGMVLFALAASGYAMFWMIAAFSAPGQEMVMGLNEFPTHLVAGWCACMVLMMGLMSYLCGRFSSRWRREFEIAKATMRKPSPPTSMMSAPQA